MTNLRVKLTTGFVTAAFVAGVVAPAGAMAATNVKVSGNGADSTNKVKVKEVKKAKVKQTNTATVANTVGVSQNTGGNKANKNTGGGVTVTSGNATATVAITNTTGGNYSAWDSECGCVQDVTIEILDNGADSENKAKVVNINSKKVSQTNSATILNTVSVSQTTGDNKANKNTGEGTVEVTSGEVNADITIDNTTGDNVHGSVTP